MQRYTRFRGVALIVGMGQDHLAVVGQALELRASLAASAHLDHVIPTQWMLSIRWSTPFTTLSHRQEYLRSIPTKHGCRSTFRMVCSIYSGDARPPYRRPGLPTTRVGVGTAARVAAG